MAFFKTFLRDYFTCTILPLFFIIIVLLGSISIPRKLDTDTADVPYDPSAYPNGGGESAKGLFWFFHVSDTHLQEGATEPTKRFEDLLNLVQALKPSFVFHTGDVTHGCPNQTPISLCYQNENDWKIYEQTLKNYNLYNNSNAKNIQWYDVKGNHDSFSVEDIDSANNYYFNYSPNNAKLNANGRRSVMSYPVAVEGGDYNFLTLDFNSYPKASYPFEAFVTPSSQTLNELEAELIASANYNHTFLFTHHPLAFTFSGSSTSETKKTLFDLLREYRVTASFVGHYHTFGLSSILLGQSSGLLELGSPSLRYNSGFQIVALDNDLLSFAQVKLGDLDEPIVIITNPTDAKYLTDRQPIKRISRSQYIRVVVFEDHLLNNYVKNVTVTINDSKSKKYLKRVDQSKPLWTAEWEPSKYSGDSLNNIMVEVKTSNGKKYTKTQTFSVVGKQKYIGTNWQQIIQRNSYFQLYFFAFLVSFLFFVIIMLLGSKFLRWFKYGGARFKQFSRDFKHHMGSNHLKQMNFLQIIKYHYVYNFWKYSKMPKATTIIFSISSLFLLCLPMSIAPMVAPNQWGVGMLFLVRISGKVQFEAITFLYATIFLCFIYFPILNVISKIVAAPANKGVKARGRLLAKPSTWFALFAFFTAGSYLVSHLMNYKVYGALLSPSLIWNGLFLFILFIRTLIIDFKVITVVNRKLERGPSDDDFEDADVLLDNVENIYGQDSEERSNLDNTPKSSQSENESENLSEDDEKELSDDLSEDDEEGLLD
ncbi:helicase related [Anaeramoeba flamelloides]|uniref:Helicase related n=1 Tax=Anaeramoeba flamelloides TaxID=1746091 RepID=A0ABQ8YT27_9EUKA|nr:helicase related [Anaeramoeba flamelloides]